MPVGGVLEEHAKEDEMVSKTQALTSHRVQLVSVLYAV